MKKINLWLLIILLLAALLRFYQLGNHPALYTDEAALGYNAYSILKTTRDEHGQFLPVSLRSFGDWKPPLSSYLMIPGIWLFGLNEWTVRLPSAVFGTLTVILVYFLVKELFHQSHEPHEPHESYKRNLLPLISSLLLAISPWHLHQSRMAMLVGIEGFFMLLGIYLFIRSFKKSSWLLIFSFISFALAIYTYYGSRITVPLIVGGLLWIYKENLRRKLKILLVSGIVMALMLLPLVWNYFQNPLVLSGRIKNVNIFTDKKIPALLWESQTLDGEKYPPNLSRFFHNKLSFYSASFLQHYFDHFSPKFLFSEGSRAEPFQVPFMAVMYLIEFPFFLYGLHKLFKKGGKSGKFIICWLIISAIASGLTIYTPASNRAFNMVVPLIIITAYGIINLKWLYGYTSIRLIFILYTLSFSFYLYQYYKNIPQLLSRQYLYGQKEMVSAVSEIEENYSQIIISSKSAPYIYFLFYKKYDPYKFWQTKKVNPQIDEFGYEYINGFAKYEFRREFDFCQEEKKPHTLYIASTKDFSGECPIDFNLKKQIFYPDGKIAYNLFDL